MDIVTGIEADNGAGGAGFPPDFGATLDPDDFDDEPRVLHNVYPASDSEEEEVVHINNGDMLRPERHGEEMLVVGQFFYDSEHIKDVVLDHALKHGRNIRQDRYDKTKLGLCCVGGNCKWRIWCSIRAYGTKWEVRTYNDEHACVPNGKCELLKISVITRLFMDNIRDEPLYYMPMKIQEIIKTKYKINVFRDQCQKAKNIALKSIEEFYNEQFKRLRDYALEIEDYNTNSTVIVETYKNDEGMAIFDRFYLCYDVLKRTFGNHCRRLLGVNGCFLEGKMKGMLLVALGRDGDNRIYPVAWAIVQKEVLHNWLWFLEKLKVDLQLGDGEGFVMTSDRQKGLIAAVDLELPRIEHRMCVRHIYPNLKTIHPRKPMLKPLLWNLAWSYNEHDFNDVLRQIYRYDKTIHADVLAAEPKKWCRAFYAIGSYCEDVDNNPTKSFNATILKARAMPIVPFLDLISRQAMVRIYKRSVLALNHTGRCTPYAQAKLQELHSAASECSIFPTTNNMYIVHHGDLSYRVSLAQRKCSCRKWDIRGIPCEHAYGVMLDKSLEVEDCVEYWFTKATWISIYQDGIVPPRCARFWPVGSDPPIHRPPSPLLPGHKKKIVPKKHPRKKGVNESPTKKKGKVSKRIMYCSICKIANHNIRYHKRLLIQSQGEASQAQGEASKSQGEPSSSQGLL